MGNDREGSGSGGGGDSGRGGGGDSGSCARACVCVRWGLSTNMPLEVLIQVSIIHRHYTQSIHVNIYTYIHVLIYGNIPMSM